MWFFVAFIQFKELQGVGAMALNRLYRKVALVLEVKYIF